jgi:hypothetical protein
VHKYILIICLFITTLFYWLLSGCYEVTINTPSFSDTAIINKKFIAGVNMEAPAQEIDSTCFTEMKSINAEWVSFIPFAFGRQGQANVIFNSGRQWWGERREGIVACIKMAHAQNMKVMLKPQLWLAGGEYCGYFKMDSDVGWQRWEENYKNYILFNAKIAEENNVELLCIGTEMDAAVKYRQHFWSKLIDSVKKTYTGKLTYAANFDCYKNFANWDKLDFIGIDAYFSLSKAKTPSVKELFIAWQPHFEAMQAFEKIYKKPILFTEYGYRNIDKNTYEPWLSNSNSSNNLVAQQNAYEALYKRFIPEKWFAGGFLWKWHVNHEHITGNTNNDYTPQNKPVEKIIKKWYKQSD